MASLPIEGYDEQPAPALRNSIDRAKYNGISVRSVADDKPVDKPASLVDQIGSYLSALTDDNSFSSGTKVGNRLFGTGGEERYQTWPEKLVREGLSAAHDVAAGEIPQYAVDANTGDVHTSPQMIQGAQAMSALAGSGGLGGVGEEAGMALGVVPVDIAKKLKFQTGKPNDILKSAVDNTPAASIDADGHLIVNMVRHQGFEQEGAESVRGGVFYLPEGSPNAKHYNGTTDNNYGGQQKIEGQTAYKNPLVVKGATGGRAPEMAYNELMGDKKAYANLNKDVMDVVSASKWMRKKDPQAFHDLMNRFLDKHAPEMRGYGDYILDNSSKGNQLRYALSEAAIASKARAAGHDGIVGYSVGRGDNKGKPFLSELFDTRESHYPSSNGDFRVHPELMADSSKPGSAIEAMKASKPFYSAVENAVAGSKQAKATPEQWLGYLKNQPGVKQEELQHLSLDKLSGPITKDELIKAVQEGQPQIKEVVKKANNGDYMRARTSWETPKDQPKYSEYQLPGGENYRETLLTLPEKANQSTFNIVDKNGKVLRTTSDKNEAEAFKQLMPDTEIKTISTYDNNAYKSSHWDEPNVLAHIRTNDRDINGKKSLHVEEVQSDWHQAGRKQGYDAPKIDLEPLQTKHEALRKEYIKANSDVISKATEGKYSTKTDVFQSGDRELLDKVRRAQENDPSIIRTRDALDVAQKEVENARRSNSGTVPDAPFKKTWDELALKHILHRAVNEGHDQVSWTPGEAQAARYDLSKQVNKIAVPMVNESGTRSVRVDAKGGSPFKLMVNKDGIVEGHGASSGQFSGKPLSDVVGKEMAEKIMKLEKPDEFSGEGLKVGGEGMKAFYDKMLVDKMNALGRKFGSKVEKQNINLRNKGAAPSDYETKPVHVFPITPELRNHIKTKGFPLFSSAPIFTPVQGNPFEENK
jgi:hypothetical protein